MDSNVVKKVEKKYFCEKCDYITSKKTDYIKHCMTAKHNWMANVSQKVANVFFCETCDYSTSKKTDYSKHCLTAKHINATKISQKVADEFCCECGKIYKNRQGLVKHKKKCQSMSNETSWECPSSSNLTSVMVMEIIKENKEIKNLLFEQQKENSMLMNKMVEISQNALTIPTTINNNNNNNNTTNNQFNLNFFLNETCKDAINFTDFIDKIQVTDNDLENNAKMGFVEGITKIIMDNLRQLELTNRPIHCTDVKRETIYVKDEDQWEKDHSKEVLQKGIQEITQLSEWRENNPEYDDMETEVGEKSIVMQQSSMAGGNRDKFYPKIIKNIAKETIIEK
jgi:uncharacterized C2H2 Zn-finger protein